MKKDIVKPKTAQILCEILEVLLVSDVHIGSVVCRAAELLGVLEEYRYKKLILLGDIFDDLNFEGLDEDQWKLMSYIQTLSEQGVEIIWVRGNHDHPLVVKMMSCLLGAKIEKKAHTWEINGVRYLAIHGHQFDKFLINNRRLNDMVSYMYLMLQKMDRKQGRLSGMVRRCFHWSWQRASEEIAQGSVEYALKKGKDYVFSGHSHHGMEKTIDGIHYCNIGCWADIDIPCHFGTISKEGVVTLHERQ
ncbi:MAG: UDP-2,3-diacylglucosamine diphosphatase [Patescibacteria group bacterium]|nr:MAG: UDP-2,3-diacylglucosamine diphosphatase [Patescibacteria group bacterium]